MSFLFRGSNHRRFRGQMCGGTMVRMPYRMYLDDSGTKDYAPVGVRYGQGVHQHFVFGGLMGDEDHCAVLAQRVLELKRRVFGKDVEIKSNWIRIEKEREKRYLQPYGLSNQDFDAFLERYYDLLCEADVQLIAAVVDKALMQATYGPSAFAPPVVALEMLAQRIQLAHNQEGAMCHLTIDEMTGKATSGFTHKELVEMKHRRLRQVGSRLAREPMRLPCLGTLSFIDSADSTLVQVADVVAYNVFRQFRDHGHDWDRDDLDELNVYEPLGRVAHKFRLGPAGQVQGYGIFRIPMVRRVPWKVNQ